MSETSETPLATQTAAPPAVPPKRPIVGIARLDDDFWARHREQQRQIAALIAQCDAMPAQNRAAIERLNRDPL